MIPLRWSPTKICCITRAGSYRRRARIVRYFREALSAPAIHAVSVDDGGIWIRLWRCRIGDFQTIAKIKDTVVTVFIIEVAHRRKVYR